MRKTFEEIFPQAISEEEAKMRMLVLKNYGLVIISALFAFYFLFLCFLSLSQGRHYNALALLVPLVPFTLIAFFGGVTSILDRFKLSYRKRLATIFIVIPMAFGLSGDVLRELVRGGYIAQGRVLLMAMLGIIVGVCVVGIYQYVRQYRQRRQISDKEKKRMSDTQATILLLELRLDTLIALFLALCTCFLIYILAGASFELLEKRWEYTPPSVRGGK